MSDIVEIEAFRKRNVGKKVHYKVRLLGSNEAWKTCEGVLTDSGVTIHESGYDVFYDFPNEEFEYSSIRAVANDGATSYLNPSPATSRVQSRAASMERATIHHGVQGVQQGVQQAADEGRAERLAIANLIAEMRESSAAERRLLLEEQRAANAAAAAERLQMQQALAQIAQATAALQNAIATQRATPAATTASAPHAPAPTTATTAADDTTIGSRFEGDVLFPGKWDLSTPEAVRLKRLEVMQTFAINNRASAFRQRAFNVLSAWMDNAYEQAEWNEALVQVGVVAMENLRSCVATEDLKVNARDLFAATATPASDKLGEAISSLAKEAEKRGRSRGRGRQDGNGYGRGGHNNSNNGTGTTNNNNNAGRGRGQGNFRGPAQQ